MIPLSQSQLTYLEACPRKFKYVFLDALSTPSSYEQQVKTQWGSQFHLLMQQRSLDLPIEVMSEADAGMMRRLEALARAAPHVFRYLPIAAKTAHSDAHVQSEQRRTLAFDDYLLTAVYDLVVEAPTRGEIFDWKTHQQPPRETWLQRSWQTRLYLYVLAATTRLAPDQLVMTYCFVRAGEGCVDDSRTDGQEARSDAPPSFYQFHYSAAQHRQTQADLQQLTAQLTEAIAQLKAGRADAAFPKVDEAKGLCDRCSFAIRCDRARTALSSNAADNSYQLLRKAQQFTVETVEEISL